MTVSDRSDRKTQAPLAAQDTRLGRGAGWRWLGAKTESLWNEADLGSTQLFSLASCVTSAESLFGFDL